MTPKIDTSLGTVPKKTAEKWSILRKNMGFASIETKWGLSLLKKVEMSTTNRKVIVVGGGAAGLMAAGTAAKGGAKVLLLEKKSRPALKLGITGKGRCNLTNSAKLTDFIARFGKNGRFLRTAFSGFFSQELLDFFEKRGVETKHERGGRIFPVGNEARLIVRALRQWVHDSGARVRTGTEVSKLLTVDGHISGVELVENAERLTADAVIVAVGGASYPVTGSTGDGVKLAKQAGHRIVPLRPSLVPLETAGTTALKLQGLSLRNAGLDVYIDGRKKDHHFGEMLFTHFGVSGPIILSASRRIVPALEEGQQVVLASAGARQARCSPAPRHRRPRQTTDPQPDEGPSPPPAHPGLPRGHRPDSRGAGPSDKFQVKKATPHLAQGFSS